jgi:hypothetical protein
VLLVVSASGSVASWSAQPISLGHLDWTLKPLVLGPDQVPRGLTVSEPARAQILECANLKQLDRWVRRALTVQSVEELLA